MSGLNLYYQNTRSLSTKTSTFLRNVYLSSYGITDSYSFTDTWLFNSSELFYSKYVVWWTDHDCVRFRQ